MTDVEEFTMDFRVGGVDRSRFRFKEGTLMPGAAFSNVSIYQDIIPNSRIVTAYTMAFGEQRFSASQATFEFVAEGNGTRLVMTEQSAFFEHADGAQRREEGWGILLASLATWLGEGNS